MNTYKVFKVLVWLPTLIRDLMDATIDTCWYYCHYRYGKGPNLNYKTNLFKELHYNFRKET